MSKKETIRWQSEFVHGVENAKAFVTTCLGSNSEQVGRMTVSMKELVEFSWNRTTVSIVNIGTGTGRDVQRMGMRMLRSFTPKHNPHKQAYFVVIGDNLPKRENSHAGYSILFVNELQDVSVYDGCDICGPYLGDSLEWSRTIKV